jgi:diaminopimelate epimerase
MQRLNERRKAHYFAKYSALGNDYVVWDPRGQIIPQLDSIQISKLCDRHNGVGADGVLMGPIGDESPFQLRIWNPDGSEAEKSGNGLRIFARYLWDAGYVQNNHLEIRLRQEIIRADRLTESSPKEFMISVGMGCPVWVHPELWGSPLPETQESSPAFPVSMGNPHCVFFVDDLDEAWVKKIGSSIETSPLFPERTNVQWAKVHDFQSASILIWERGAGFTLASGSSSCAVVAAGQRLGKLGRNVEVSMPGGKVFVKSNDEGQLTLTGEVRSVAWGELYEVFF